MRWFWLGLALWAGLIFPSAAQQANGPYGALLAHYAVYQDDTRWLDTSEITTPAALDEALDRAARHDPAALSQGWIAYGAMSASAAADFVRGVQARVRATSRAAVLRRLMVDDAYARNRPAGSGQAIGYILQGAALENARLAHAADRFSALGDTLRGQAWAATAETDRAERETRLRALVAPAAAQPFTLSLPSSALTSAQPRADRRRLIDQMLTLAALRVLNATDANAARTQTLLSDDVTARCLNLSRLQLRQCVSVTQFPYENAYCLARHGLSGPAACFALAR